MDTADIDSQNIHIEKRVKINPLIRALIFSDFLVISAFAIYGPIFAIFISQQIEGGSAGLAASFYWITRSIFQLPISHLLDKKNAEKNNFWALTAGSLIFSAVPFMYIFASLPWHVFLLQGIYGFADCLAAPTYLSIFSHHLDKKKENIEWGVRSVSIGIGTSLAAVLGGYVADKHGFDTVFLLTGIFAMTGATTLIFITRHHLKKGHRAQK